jgi:hypothetical protein
MPHSLTYWATPTFYVAIYKQNLALYLGLYRIQLRYIQIPFN